MGDPAREDRLACLLFTVEYLRLAGKAVQGFRDRRRLDHAAQGRQITREHGDPARGRKGLVIGPDDLASRAVGEGFERLRQRAAQRRQAVGVQQGTQFAHQRGDASGLVKVRHVVERGGVDGG